MNLAFVSASEEFPEDEVNFVDVSLFSQTDSSFVVHKEVIPCSTRLGHFGRNQVIRHGMGCGGVCLCPVLLSVNGMNLAYPGSPSQKKFVSQTHLLLSE